MSDPYVRPVDCIADIDEAQLRIGVDYDAVSLGMAGASLRFGPDEMEALMQALARACWEAGANARLMAEEVPAVGDG